MKPRMTMGSRPSLFEVRAPSRPNVTPPNTSPTPIKMPDKPTSCFADSPICVVNPMLGEYTPLKNESSRPVMRVEKKKIVNIVISD
jgi:hypothetical protein